MLLHLCTAGYWRGSTSVHSRAARTSRSSFDGSSLEGTRRSRKLHDYTQKFSTTEFTTVHYHHHRHYLQATIQVGGEGEGGDGRGNVLPTGRRPRPQPCWQDALCILPPPGRQSRRGNRPSAGQLRLTPRWPFFLKLIGQLSHGEKYRGHKEEPGRKMLSPTGLEDQ